MISSLLSHVPLSLIPNTFETNIINISILQVGIIYLGKDSFAKNVRKVREKDRKELKESKKRVEGVCSGIRYWSRINNNHVLYGCTDILHESKIIENHSRLKILEKAKLKIAQLDSMIESKIFAIIRNGYKDRKHILNSRILDLFAADLYLELSTSLPISGSILSRNKKRQSRVLSSIILSLTTVAKF